MKDVLMEAVRKSAADYTEIRFEIEDTTGFGYRGKEFDRVGAGKFAGGMVRACTRGGWGMAMFDSPQELDRKVQEACACAALVGKERTELELDDSPVDAMHPAVMTSDFRGVSLDEKIHLLGEYNDIVMTADAAIESSSVWYEERMRSVHYVSSLGSYFFEERPRVILSVNATARDGSLVQNLNDSISSALSFDVVRGFHARAQAVADRAVALLKAPKCEGGCYTVILDQELGGVFAHEAFGHLSEADFLYENPKMRELMHLGRPMGVPELNIIDDGSLGQLLGTHAFDDEGRPTQRTYLIQEGTLVGHLHSRETAAKMGAKPTGNARALRRNVPPIVRMTNTYIEPGSVTFDDLLAGIEDGIYAVGSIGGQTMLEQFTFSAKYGYRICNGQIAELVRDVVLTGNVFETLKSIDGLGDDLQICEMGGGCGKNGQHPLPVTFGAPHLRIRNVVVGGS